jgi:hypothetical protein
MRAGAGLLANMSDVMRSLALAAGKSPRRQEDRASLMQPFQDGREAGTQNPKR